MNEQSDQLQVAGLSWTNWPTQHMPTNAEILDYVGRHPGGAKSAIDVISGWNDRREHLIQCEIHDPLSNGWEPPPMRILRKLIEGTYVDPQGVTHKANDILMLGGNGSGKTDMGGKLIVETLMKRPRTEARAFSQNEKTSINYQQPSMYKYMPPALRGVKKQGGVTKISYSVATGFSEMVFVLPNSSKCLMFSYKGWEQDKTSAEGGEAKLVINDEPPPVELVRTQRFRVHKANGVLISTFTPVNGFTETVAEYVDGAEVLEELPVRDITYRWPSPWHPRETYEFTEWLLPENRDYVDGCKPGHVPFVLKSSAAGRYVIVCPTLMNPYLTGRQAIITSAMNGNTDFALERLWGWPTKRAMRVFPRFDKKIHVISSERVPQRGTRYLLGDPHGRRNWFLLWLLVDANNRWFFYREWPDHQTVGEWAVPGDKPDGRQGPAQKAGGGRSFSDYKRLVLRAEGWVNHPDLDNAVMRGERVEEVSERLLDPRPAGIKSLGEDGQQTLLEVLAESTVDASGRVLVPGMDFAAGPASAVKDEIGISFINDMLSHGPERGPRMFVTNDCKNLIFALLTWTGADGEDGATKDPIDCMRMAAKHGCQYYAPQTFGSNGGGSY